MGAHLGLGFRRAFSSEGVQVSNFGELLVNPERWRVHNEMQHGEGVSRA
jgi:hypothetical protein